MEKCEGIYIPSLCVFNYCMLNSLEFGWSVFLDGERDCVA